MGLNGGLLAAALGPLQKLKLIFYISGVSLACLPVCSGFCTPGMAVACHTALARARARKRGQRPDNDATPTAQEMRDALDGNLCRCTGYRPIVDACKVCILERVESGGVWGVRMRACAHLRARSLS